MSRSEIRDPRFFAEASWRYPHLASSPQSIPRPSLLQSLSLSYSINLYTKAFPHCLRPPNTQEKRSTYPHVPLLLLRDHTHPQPYKKNGTMCPHIYTFGPSASKPIHLHTPARLHIGKDPQSLKPSNLHTSSPSRLRRSPNTGTQNRSPKPNHSYVCWLGPTFTRQIIPVFPLVIK